MNEIKLSVILPNYNNDKYLAKSINSFLNQDYENKEFIIVDGKSSDSSHRIIEKYTSGNKNIVWVKEKDINVTDAINIGLKYCTGDFISFLASDAFYFDNDIFSTINAKHHLLPFDVVYFDHYFYFTQTRRILINKCTGREFSKNNLLMHGTFVGLDNIFISKDVYQKHKYDPKYNLCSDWELYLRISQEKLLFFYMEKICTVTVQDGDNLTQKYRQEQIRQIKEVALLYNSDNVSVYINAENSIKAKLKRIVKRIIK